MALNGPILIIDDDANDAEVMTTAIREIGIPNTIKIMKSSNEAYQYLCDTDDRPYVILCDIRMPGIDGLAFRKRIKDSEYLRKKAIPFLFFTGLVSDEIVNSAYDLDVQGFFEKGNSYDAVKDQLLSIFIYWKRSIHPNRRDLFDSKANDKQGDSMR